MKKSECYRGLILLLACGIGSEAQAQDEHPAPTSFSAMVWDYLINGSSLSVGVGGREAGLTVKRLSDNASGKLVQRDQKSYFLIYNTRPAFFGDSKMGYDVMFNLSTFRMDQQQTGSSVYQDLGTGAHGRFAYVVPTVFRMWGDHQRGTYLKAGIGLGLGMATFDGDIVLTDSATRDRITISHQTTELRFATSVVFEARWKNWGFLLTVAGPDVQQNGFDIQITDVALSFGYRYVF
ncbi:MAG TPA: hypothetical protein VK138_12400 [Acidiferrobacterales bacterium]|nr:hypothetical protein [Acidiferrobacterales bacterium]